MHKVDIVRLSIPMTETFHISSGEVSEREAIVLHVSDGASLGWGESFAMPGAFYSNDTIDSCQLQLPETLLRS